MKPSHLRLDTSEKSSAFFHSPFRPTQLSPIPDASPLPAFDNARASSPLLPLTPSMLESGGPRGSYAFPTENGGWFSRLRLAIVGKSSGRGSLTKRIVLFGALLALLTVVYHHDQAIKLGRYAYSSQAAEVSEAQTTNSRYPVAAPLRTRPKTPIPPPTAEPYTYSSPLYSDTSRRLIDISSDALPLEATLRERLDAWRDAPGGRGEIEGEVELGGFVQWNLEQCDTIHEQHNTHMIQKSANIWATMNRTTLHHHRMTLINYMEEVLESNLISDHGSGRGIVTVAGNADTLQRVKWSLQMLRSYGSTLPVQIYHFPSERPDPDSDIVRELQELGAELVEAQGQARDKGKNKSYHLKAIAVVQCPWQEVLYLDSDSIPARDPEYMFDAPNYKRLGIWATPDYWKTSANNPIWAIAGVKCRNEWEMETGQMFIDKKLHLDVFLLVKYMLENHEWWFFFSDGDKDIFRWALLMLRKRWGVPGRWVGAGALPSGTASGEFCAHTMIQHDSWGEPLFVHYNLLKQIPSGVGRGYSWGRTKQLPLFNLFPASPATARLGEPLTPPKDDDLPGLGDVDCDMLADADERGVARAPAKEMIMRRAVREQGVKVRYHGGWISALCIDLDYFDPRPEERQESDRLRQELEAEARAQKESEWEKEAERAREKGLPEPPKVQEETKGPVIPDWGQSPIEIVQWRDDPHLVDFEQKLYDFGFVPSGPGF